MEVPEPDFTVFHRGVSVPHVGPSVPERLDLGPGQHQSGLHGLHDVVEVAGLTIVGNHLDAVIAFALYFLLVPKYGGMAAAWITVFSEAFIALATAIMVLNKSGARPSMALPVRSLIASVLMYMSLVMLPDMNVLLKILIGIVLYFGLLILFGGLKKDTLEMFKNRNRNAPA